MKKYEIGTDVFSNRSFHCRQQASYENNGASMRNDSSTGIRRRICFFALLPAFILASFSVALHAQQCADEDDPGSIDCQLSQPVNTSSPTGESPASLSLQQQQQPQPRPDRSGDASANGSLSNGENYTEQTSPENRMNRFPQMELPRRPEPPTEFQKFVAATTGQMLPIYGAELFSDRGATFGPILNAPAPAELLVAAGDQLRIRIWGQVNFSANLLVSRAGEIYLPKVGAVHVAGLTLSQAQDHLHQALDRIYRNFELSVDLGEIHSIQIYVTGEARRPGEYTVSALSTLVDAVFASGGPSNAGSMRHIELRRDGKVIADFDLYALLVNGDKTGDVQLQPGDVLFIPATGPQVALLGSIRQPGIYELRGTDSLSGAPGGSLGAALDAAGGRTAIAGGTRISVDRIEGHVQRRTLELTADDAGLASALADGDIVRVDPIESAYRDTVTLRGSVANPGRYRWHAGMRLSDLLPDRDALLTRGYWWRRTQLGFPAPEFVGAAGEPAGAWQAGNSQPNGTAEPTSNAQPYANSPAATGGFTSSGESQQPAQTEKPAAMLSPGLQTDWKYAVIERVDPETMTTSLISFDLGRLVLDHDLSEDRELQAGDVVTIFSQDDVHPPVDQRTKYVQLDGEIVNAGVYSVRPGETLRSLVMRAGGLTAKAYLYGAEFTRKSTQAIEQQRMNDYADRLEHNMERSALAINDQESGAGGPETFNPAASVNRSLVTRLRQLRAEGRVVLNLSPESNSAADLPDIPLEDGDKLVIPPTPSTIQVIGAVFNQNAFLYRRGARASEYLRYAGGPTRDADRGQTFVLRADGSVFSRSEKQSIFASGSFENVRLYPGDTIVVPEKMVRPSALREVAEWTQLMSQLSISAAAIDVIK
jgi:polysaccharide export outer membrane protein